MAGRSQRGSLPFAWTTTLYLLLVFIAPLAFLNTAYAEDQKPIQEQYGDGELPCESDFFGLPVSNCSMQSLVSIWEQPTPASV